MPPSPICPKGGCDRPIFNRFCLQCDREAAAKAREAEETAEASPVDVESESDPSD